MDTYIKTIINGLKAWVTSCLSRLESSVSGNLATMADKLTSLSNKVQQAQTTAQSAQTTAANAQTTATQAQTTANQAQTTATNAQTTATNAQTTANQALPKSGGTMTGPLTVRYNGSGQDYSRVTIKPTLKNGVPVVRIEGGGQYYSTVFENRAVLDHIGKIILTGAGSTSNEYELSVDANGNLTLDGGENPAQIGPSDEKINQMIAQSIEANRIELDISNNKLPNGMTSAELFKLLEEKDVFVWYAVAHCKIVTWEDYSYKRIMFFIPTGLVVMDVLEDGTLEVVR